MTEITLEQLLASRDARASYQRELMGGWGLPLVSFTVNMPGPEKLSERSRYIFRRGSDAIRETLAGNIAYLKERMLPTGPEGFYLVSLEPLQLKELMCGIEDGSELGRLFDIDVIDKTGPISRESVGRKMRKCLVCGRPGAACARSRRHELSELMAAIDGIISRSKGA
ncbi:MAG: citrate lyase holo-[Clostridia bacterium]|nr:citrate lyase holo-[acyl-carrier protein] synthase [Clostridia bacterium]